MLKSGSFPREFGPSVLSSLDREESILKSNNITSPLNVGIYAYDKTLFTFIRHPRDTNYEECIIYAIVRDFSGRYVWKMRLNLNDFGKEDVFVPPEKRQTNGYNPHQNIKTEQLSENTLHSLFYFLNDSEKQFHKLLEDFLYKNFERDIFLFS